MPQIKLALITGGAGFAGSHLSELLASRGIKAVVLDIQETNKVANFVRGDVTDRAFMKKLLADLRPDVVFHLAAHAFVPFSWAHVEETINVNFGGTAAVLDGIREAKIDPVVTVACSSEEYGLVFPEEVPIKETNPLRPLSPYAVSKIATDFLAYQYVKSYGMKVIRTRAFNHYGPRQQDLYVCSSFVRQALNAKKGGKILVGNLEAKRDFTFVTDVAEAYLLAAELGEPGEVYNICSGTAISMRDVLALILKEVGGLDWSVVQTDPSRMRPSDVSLLLGDSSKFRALTGWTPKVSFEEGIRRTIEYWRRRDG
jgi:GDP-4-dehydro-6-deoxy-D-mannose reductase